MEITAVHVHSQTSWSFASTIKRWTRQWTLGFSMGGQGLNVDFRQSRARKASGQGAGFIVPLK